MDLQLLSTAQEERWQPTLCISQSVCCPGIITNTGRMLRFSRFRTKLYHNSFSEYFLYVMPNLKWNSMEYSNVPRKRQKNTTQGQQSEGTSSREDQDPKVNSLQEKKKKGGGAHGTRSRNHNLLPRVQCFPSRFPLITVILVNFFFCTRFNIPNSKWIQGSLPEQSMRSSPRFYPIHSFLSPSIRGFLNFSTTAFWDQTILQRKERERVFYDCSSFPNSIYQMSVTVTIGGGGVYARAPERA